MGREDLDPAAEVARIERIRGKYPLNSYDRAGLRPRTLQDTSATEVSVRAQLTRRNHRAAPPVTLAGQPRRQEP